MAKVKVDQVYEDKYMKAEVLKINTDTIHCKVFFKQTQGTRERDLHESRLLEMKKTRG